jgi:hypothetical protein
MKSGEIRFALARACILWSWLLWTGSAPDRCRRAELGRYERP